MIRILSAFIVGLLDLCMLCCYISEALPAEAVMVWLIATAPLVWGAGFVAGSETPEETHEYCYPETCSHKRELLQYSHIASHRRVHA